MKNKPVKEFIKDKFIIAFLIFAWMYILGLVYKAVVMSFY